MCVWPNLVKDKHLLFFVIKLVLQNIGIILAQLSWIMVHFR